MCSLSDGLFLRPLLGSFTALIFQHTLILLLLTDHCQCQETGPSQTVTASVGDDVLLPCHLEPAADVVSESLEWGRLDLEPRFVHVWHEGQNLLANQNPLYQGRTSLFVDKLKLGDLSLKLSAVRHSDNGLYRCYFPSQRKALTVKLVVGSVASAAIAGIHITSSGAVLQCESRGWYPEPELLWLDAEGNLLPSGPTETVPGPDGLYTVSGRATVEQRHGSSFTCRVRQSNTNQSRETHIQVADDFFRVQPGSSSSPVTIFLVVILAVCIFLILLFGFFMWKRGQNQIKAMKGRWHKTNDGERKKVCKTDGQEDEQELEQLVTHEPGQMEDVNEGEEGTKTKPVSPEPGPGFNDKDEKNRGKESGQRKDQVERSQAAPAPPSSSSSSSFFSSPFNWRIVSRQELQELEQEVATRTEQADDLAAKVKTLTEEKQNSQSYSQQLQTQLDTRTKELREEKSWRQKTEIERDELKEELEKTRTEADELAAKVKTLTEEKQKSQRDCQQLQTQLREEKSSREKAQTERDKLKEDLEKTRTKADELAAKVTMLTEEKQNSQRDCQQLQTQLDTSTKELQEEKSWRKEAEREKDEAERKRKEAERERDELKEELEKTRTEADELAAKVKTLTEKQTSQSDCQQETRNNPVQTESSITTSNLKLNK